MFQKVSWGWSQVNYFNRTTELIADVFFFGQKIQKLIFYYCHDESNTKFCLCPQNLSTIYSSVHIISVVSLIEGWRGLANPICSWVQTNFDVQHTKVTVQHNLPKNEDFLQSSALDNANSLFFIIKHSSQRSDPFVHATLLERGYTCNHLYGNKIDYRNLLAPS